MSNIVLWVGFLLLIVLMGWLNHKQSYSKKLRKAIEELRQLIGRYSKNESRPEDLADWERCLGLLEAHPNEYNKLEHELRLRHHFVLYLLRHHPKHELLPHLREAAEYEKDSIWGIKINKNSK